MSEEACAKSGPGRREREFTQTVTKICIFSVGCNARFFWTDLTPRSPLQDRLVATEARHQEKGDRLLSAGRRRHPLPRSNPANRPGTQTMPECSFNKSNEPSGRPIYLAWRRQNLRVERKQQYQESLARHHLGGKWQCHAGRPGALSHKAEGGTSQRAKTRRNGSSQCTAHVPGGSYHAAPSCFGTQASIILCRHCLATRSVRKGVIRADWGVNILMTRTGTTPTLLHAYSSLANRCSSM